MLDKKVTIQLKGIAAIFIMLGHLLPDTAPDWTRMLFYGPVWVGVFFFISGYGMRLQANADSGYIRRLMPGKVLSVWIPFAIAELIYLFSLRYLIGEKLSVGKILGCTVGLPLVNNVLWFVPELIILQLLFFLLERFKSKEKLYMTLWLGCYVTFLIAGVVFDIGTWWYLSTISFVAGIWFANHGDLVIHVLGNKAVSLFLVLLAVNLYVLTMVAIVYNITPESIKPGYYINGMTLILVPVFTVAVMASSMGREGKNGVLTFLGEISYSIYLYHVCVRMWVGRLLYGLCNKAVIMLVQVAVTIAVGMIIRAVKELWQKRESYT